MSQTKIHPTNPNARWINTRVEYQWDGAQYVEVATEGYWYDGPMALAHDQPNTGLDAYRFYDSANTTAIDVQSADPTALDADTTYVFRVRIQNTNNADESAGTYNLEYENSTQATGWLAVTAASNHVRAADATGLTDGTAVTSGTLTGASGSLVNGEEVEDGVSASITITANNYTELWYAITLRSADVANNDNINLRVTRGGTLLDFETVSPSITASVPVVTTITLTPQSLTVTEGTLSVQADVDTNVSLTPQALIVTEGTLSVTQTSATEITLTPQALSMSSGTLSVQADVDTTVSLTPQALSVTPGALSVNDETNVTLTPQALVVTEGQLTISAQQNTEVTLTPQALSVGLGTLAVQADVDTNVSLTPQALSVTPGTLTVTAAVNQTITLTPQALTVTPGTLAIYSNKSIDLTAQALVVTEAVIPISTGGGIAIDLVADTLVITAGSPLIFVGALSLDVSWRDESNAIAYREAMGPDALRWASNELIYRSE